MTKKEAEDQQSRTEQTALLREIKSLLQDKNQSEPIKDSTTISRIESQRWRWLSQLSMELKDSMRKIFRTNVQTYTTVMRMESMLAGHLEKTLFQEPFVLEDAIGRIAPVHMQFVNSWEAFDAVLQLRFQHFPGEQKIKRKEFVLQDQVTNQEIDRSYPWEASFVPGQRVNMSMLFVNHGSATTSCPKCSMSSSGSQDSEIHW